MNAIPFLVFNLQLTFHDIGNTECVDEQKESETTRIRKRERNNHVHFKYTMSSHVKHMVLN